MRNTRIEVHFLETGPHLPKARVIEERFFNAPTVADARSQASKYAGYLMKKHELRVVAMAVFELEKDASRKWVRKPKESS